MNVELKPDYELTDEACEAATGKTLTYWFEAIAGRPELKGKRREAVNLWLYPEMGKNIWWAATAWVEFERRNGIVQKDGRIEGYNICVTKSISAPVETVFQAWTHELIGDWFGDSAKVSDDKSIEDARGTSATAIRVRENKDLRYRWTSGPGGQETQVEVAFADAGKGKTGITLTHNRIQTRDEADGLRRAWGEAFNRLKAALE
ncbi:MAG TPA: SRPBCC domain-containing protein [Fimbriimonadaceae bacterium]|nr:SRPBCC domain-containing protein [Fimbriimonadaceae bacterium]